MTPYSWDLLVGRIAAPPGELDSNKRRDCGAIGLDQLRSRRACAAAEGPVIANGYIDPDFFAEVRRASVDHGHYNALTRLGGAVI